MRHLWFWLLGLTLVSGLLSAGGCGVVSAVKEGLVSPPVAEVVGVSVVDATGEATALEALVRLRNDNDVEVPIESVRVRMVGPGGEVFVSEAPATVSMPPRGAQVLSVRGVLPVVGVEGSSVSVVVSVRWVPPGEVRSILTESGVPLPVVVGRGGA